MFGQGLQTFVRKTVVPRRPPQTVQRATDTTDYATHAGLQDVVDMGEYEDEYTCNPPAVCMIIVSIIEVSFQAVKKFTKFIVNKSNYFKLCHWFSVSHFRLLHSCMMSLKLVDLQSVDLLQNYSFTILVKDHKPGGTSHICLYMWGELLSKYVSLFVLYATWNREKVPKILIVPLFFPLFPVFFI